MMRIGFDVQLSALTGTLSQSGPWNPIMSAARARRKTVLMILVPLRMNVSAGLLYQWRRFRATTRHDRTARERQQVSLSGSPAVDLKGPSLDPRNQLTTKLDRIVQGVEPADEERIDAERVVFENRLCDLFGSADKA